MITVVKSLLLVTAVVLSTSGVAAERVLVRTSVQDGENVWVGQQVAFKLEVLGRDGWANIPRLPEFDIDGAYMMRVQTQGTRLSETIDGESYTGQGYRWLLFPQRDGVVRVPETPVEVELKQFGAGAESESVLVDAPELSFQAMVPPGAENLDHWISTRALQVSQTFEPKNRVLTAGDGLRRTVVIEAEGVAGMAIAPLEFEAPTEVAVYPGEPEVRDEVNRGVLQRGVRVETVSYVPREGGEYSLPDIEIAWWDIESETIKRETLPGTTVVVSAPVGGGAQDESEDSGGPDSESARYVFIVFIVLGLLLAGFSLRRRLASVWAAWRRARDEREAAYFKRFVAAANDDDPTRIVTELMRWIDRLQPSRSPMGIENLMRSADQANAIPEVLELVRRRLAGDADRQAGAQLVRRMKRVRYRVVKEGRQRSTARREPLAALNP